MASEAKFRTVLPNNTISAAVDYTGESDVYQSKLNTLGPAEMSFHANDIDFDLPGARPGVRTTVNVPPTYKLLKQVFIEIAIPEDSAVNVNCAGMNMIQEWGYRVPGCERMIFDGEGMIFQPILECENLEKRNEYLRLNGNRQLTTTLNGVVVSNTNASPKYEYGGQGTTGFRYFYTILSMPWSSLNASKQPKPYPSHLTTQPLEIDILFRRAVDAGLPSALDNQNFSSARMLFIYETLANMNLYKNTVYKYNFSAPYHIRYPIEATSEDKVTLNLRGLRNGEITELRLLCRPRGTYDNEYLYRYDGRTLHNLEVFYAGQKLWKNQNGAGKMIDLMYNRVPNEYAVGLRKNIKLAPIAEAGTATDNTDKIDLETITIPAVDNILNSVPARSVLNLGVASLDSNKVFSHKLDTYESSHTFYVVPIATILDHMRNSGDYSLGADFKDSDLKIQFDHPFKVWDIAAKKYVADSKQAFDILLEYRLNSIYQFDGQSAKLIQ